MLAIAKKSLFLPREKEKERSPREKRTPFLETLRLENENHYNSNGEHTCDFCKGYFSASVSSHLNLDFSLLKCVFIFIQALHPDTHLANQPLPTAWWGKTFHGKMLWCLWKHSHKPLVFLHVLSATRKRSNILKQITSVLRSINFCFICCYTLAFWEKAVESWYLLGNQADFIGHRGHMEMQNHPQILAVGAVSFPTLCPGILKVCRPQVLF